MGKTILIAGAGLGGLSTALRLAKKGYRVTVLEKNAVAGGRLNRLRKDGFTWDVGPSFFSMSYEFEALARDCGIKLPFSYNRVDPLYAVNFPNGNKYLLHSNIKKLAAQFAHIEPNFESEMIRYLADSKRLFDGTIDHIVKTNHNSLAGYLAAMTKTPPQFIPLLFRNFWAQVSRYFKATEVKEIMSLVAFFLGASPFETSSIYTLLSYTEFEHDGYYNVQGGMYQIVEGLLQELEKERVEIVYGAEVVSVETDGERVAALVDQHGRRHQANAYVINADAATFRGRVLQRKAFSEARLSKMHWTFAPLTIYLGIRGNIDGIYHHNYYLGNNYNDYANKIFRNNISLEKPYYYVNVLSHSNADCAPAGHSSLFFVCPMPDLRFKPLWDDAEQITTNIIDDFSNKSGNDIRQRIVSKTIYTPVDWERMFGLYKGSGLGLAHDLMQVGYFRPHNVDEYFSNLFYVGASTTPGTGLPMCVIGSKLVVDQIEVRHETL